MTFASTTPITAFPMVRNQRVCDVPRYSSASADRFADSRPVMSRERLIGLGQKLIGMSKEARTFVALEHVSHIVTRMSNGRVMSSDDGDFLKISVVTRVGSAQVRVETNQLTDDVLRDVMQQCETMGTHWTAGELQVVEEPRSQDSYLPVALWHDTTVRAMQETRETLLPSLLNTVKSAGLLAAGSLGFMAKSYAFFDRQGIQAFMEETDSELTITARSRDGQSSGWGGQAARDWSKMNPGIVAAHAIDMAQRGIGAQAVEPQRRTVILTTAAVAQVMRLLAEEFDGWATTQEQRTAFSKPPNRARYRERIFDPRITMTSDPADPDGGYSPFFGLGWRNSPMTWVKDGTLQNLHWEPRAAVARGLAAYADLPRSIRISGGNSTIEEMIAQCQEGIFVNRFSNVELLDLKTGMMTGVTRDGCFLIKNGKIDRPVKNFRFLDSPFFMLNNVVALGPTQRAAFGYTPPGQREIADPRWPRLPIIVPSMMVKDFNFSALATAV